MSEMAKTARKAMKDKVKRLVEQADPKAKVDGSSYTPPEMLDADVQTGMRPISRRQFKRGGAVAEGEEPKKRADRRSRRKRRTGRDLPKYEVGGMVDEPVPATMRSAAGKPKMPDYNEPAVEKAIEVSNRAGRKIGKKEGSKIRRLLKGRYKDGGSVPLTADSLVNKDMKEANEKREGKKHIGGLKKGGRAERKAGGRTGKMGGGAMEVLSPAYALSKNKKALKALSPIANLKRGGMAHSDVKMDTALIKSAMRKHEKGKHPGTKLTKLANGGMALDGQMQGTRPTGGRLARKDGGTVTNIYFDSKKGGGEGPPGGLMPPMMPPPMPPMPPPGGPPGGPPMPPPHMGPPPGGPPMGPPPGMPPGGPPGMPPMMRRAGGRVGHRTYRKPQDMDAGAGSGLGRLEKIQIQKGK